MGQSSPGGSGGSTKAKSGVAASGKKRKLSWKLRLFFVWPIYGVLAAALGVGVSLIHYTIAFPNPLDLRAKERAPVIRILARDGSLLATRGKAHDFMPFDLMPRHVIDAVIATEDRRFFSHWGVDPFGLIRATFANMRAGRYTQGGSTLTQQLAKNLFLSPERTLSRKFEELLLALWLEVRLSKREILELYLNRVYFGGGAYGIEAASQRYFDKSASGLNIGEAAMIAGLLKAPSRYSPRANPGLARKRARAVLRKMHAAGFLDIAKYKRLKRRSLRFAKTKKNRRTNGLEYAIDFILERLPSVAGTDRGQLIVETTIDAALQRRAQATVTKMLRKEPRLARASQAAVAILDPRGRIQALVGGRSYRASQFNRASKAKRQPGSAFKLFVYLAALESGLKPTSIIQDAPVDINGWKPRNIGGRYRGPITMRTGLVHSVNSVAVRLHMDVSPRQVVRTAKRLGIRSHLNTTPSLALGTSEVKLLEMTGAYGVFANGGRKVQPHVIRRIKMSTGRVLYARKAAGVERIVKRAHVGAMNDMLNAALVVGTGKRAAIEDHPAAGKTGTSQDFRDAWFVGYTAHYVTGVWVGNDNNRPMNKVMGGGLPARIWRKLMRDAHADLAPTALPGTRLLPKKRQLRPSDRPVGKPDQAVSQRPPRMPKERIGEDFIARALRGGGGDNGYAAVADNTRRSARRNLGQTLERQDNLTRAWSPVEQRPGEPAHDGVDDGVPVAVVASSNAYQRPRQNTQSWGFNIDALKRTLGMSPEPPARPRGYMSLGGTPARQER